MYWNSNDGFSNALITASIPFPSLYETSMSTAWVGVPSRMSDTEAASTVDFKGPSAGSRVGPYRLLERLGQGGQADVWRALRLEPTLMEVALKFIPEQGQDPRKIAQLRREADRGLRLSGAGPGLVRAFAFGEADGLWFMAMPLVIGTTLGAILSQRRAYLLGRGQFDNGAHKLATLSEPQYTRDILTMIARIARSLADAHAARIVHRDIKPLNILVPKNHREGAWLCDFGLGRDLDVATPDQLLDGAGSPHYMAPERLLKTAADEYLCEVFALGATLFEAVTLALPIMIPSELPRTRWNAYLAKAKPLRPRKLRPDLDRRLESIMLKAIAREPAGRHPSALSLAIDLEALSRTFENETRDGV